MIQRKDGASLSSQVEPVRAASRRLVRELGFLRDGLADTGLPPSAVHALMEMEARGPIRAGELSDLLSLEKSSVSRLLRKLVEAGEVRETPGEPDGRTKTLTLTPRGRARVAGIHGFARRQVSAALAQIEPQGRATVMEGLRLYADALAVGRAPAADPTAADIQAADVHAADIGGIAIETGHRPGALGRCIEMHARYYAGAAGFGPGFETLVASGLAEFSGRLNRPGNRLWLAVQAGRIVGTVAIDGEDLGGGIAHLRWFIVEDGLRGAGAGRRLLREAVAFCDRGGLAGIHLWTFRGLDAARRLYEAEGFALAEERAGHRWGTEVLEQRFVRGAAP